MTGVTFAATHRLVGARARRVGMARRSPQSLRCALALGLVFAFAAAAAADDRTGLQREIRETQEIAAEMSKAVRRVQAENLKLRRTLGDEAQNLTAEDITATTLRLGRLDADTARLHVTTLENRIAQRRRRCACSRKTSIGGPRTCRARRRTRSRRWALRAELQQLRELHAVSIDLIDGLRKLQSAEAESLALAEERLALLRSRAELRTIPETGRFDQDPRVVAIRAIISRLARDAVRLDNEAGAARPKSAPDPARKRLLQLQAGDAIIRSSVRVADLELIRTANQLDFYGDLISDESIPVAILRDARGGTRRPTSAARTTPGGAQWRPPHVGGPARAHPCPGCRVLQTPGRRSWARCRIWPGSSTSNKPTSRGCSNASAKWRAKLDAEIGQREFGALRERGLCRPTPGIGSW